MFDIIKTIGQAFTGAFAGNADLRKGFWPFIFILVLSYVCLVYNAYMSISFYEAWLENAPHANELAILITFAIAAGILFAMAQVCAFIIDIWRHGESEHSKVGILLLSVILIATITWDIYANMQGVAPVSHQTTASIIDNQAEEAARSYDGKIAEQQAIIDGILKRYTWKGRVWFQPDKWHPVTQWRQDTATVNRARRQIAQYNELATAAAQAALDDYNRDKARYDQAVSVKTFTHKTIVKWVYLLVFLLSLFVAFYVNEAQAYVTHMKETGGYADSSSLFARFVKRSQAYKPATGGIGFNQQSHRTPPPSDGPTFRSGYTRSGMDADYLAKRREQKKARPVWELNLPEIKVNFGGQIWSRNGGKSAGQKVVGNDGEKSQEEAPVHAVKTSPNFRQNGGQKPVNVTVENTHTNLNPETPYNLGKKYDLTRSQKQKVNKVRKVYLAYVKSEGQRPTLTELAKRSGMHRQTVKKYVQMMQKDGQQLLNS